MGMFAAVGSRLIERWELDRVQLAALRKVQRRSGLGLAASTPADAQSRSRWRTAAPFYFTFVLYAVLGLAGVGGVLFPSFFFGFAFSYTLIMLIVGFTLFNYFTTVLLDTSENRILLHLPISGRTLLAARILCIAKYAGLLALSVSLPTAVALAVRFGAVALLIFSISLMLTLIFVVSVTLAVCLFALRYVKPARLRQGILYFQTMLTCLAIYAGTIVMNADVPLVETLPDVSGTAWWYFYPPGWMAGLLEFSLMEKTLFNGVLAATAVLAPLAGFGGCMLLFAGGRFTALLSRLEVVPRSSALMPKSTQSWLARLPEQLSVLINGDKQQRAVFDLTSKLMKRDMALNLNAYAVIGVILVNIGYFVVQHHDRQIQDLPLSIVFALNMSYYMPLVLAVMASQRMQFSAEWQAAWCYQVLPFATPGVIVSGAAKVVILKYIFPFYLFLLIVSASVWGIVLALDALFAGAVATLAFLHRSWSAARVLPYSNERVYNMTRNDGRASRLVFIPIALGLIVAHVVLKTVAGGWGVVGGIVAMGYAIIVVYRKLRFMGSKDVEAPDRHVGWHRS